MEPSRQHDQYVAYIDPSTGLIRKLQYTLREFARFVQFTMHYDDYVEVAGVKIAQQQSLTGKPDDSPDKFMHRITVKHVEFGTPPATTFVVDEGLPVLGDQKLATN